MKIKIDVTQKDIYKGCIGKGDNCPVARAIIRTLKRAKIFFYEIDVDSNDILIESRYASLRIPTPCKTSIFINRFDNSKTVKPFNFQLRLF